MDAAENVQRDFPTIRFPGQYYDAETKLHYNRFRYYDPSVGRYISADPIGQFGGGDKNLYSYVWNNPLSWIDPYGLKTLRCSRGLGDKDKPPKKPSGDPLRHDYLVADDEVLSFQAGDNVFWSDGSIEDDEHKSNDQCEVISDDPEFDEAVKDAASEVGEPKYNFWAYPGTTPHMLGARNCQTWVDDVLRNAEEKVK